MKVYYFRQRRIAVSFLLKVAHDNSVVRLSMHVQDPPRYTGVAVLTDSEDADKRINQIANLVSRGYGQSLVLVEDTDE